MHSDWLSERLINSLGLIPMRSKGSPVVDNPGPPANPITNTDDQRQAPSTQTVAEPVHPPQLDKHEFRLLVNMLKAIDHECQYDHMQYDGVEVRYQLGPLTLVFNDLNAPDDHKHMNLASLADIIQNPELKRPVWEKLKTLKRR